MRIAIITQYFPPDPPSWIPGGLAHALAERGHEVNVLTTFPHYTTGRVSHGYRQRLHHVESVGDLRVRRVPLFASHSDNAIARIANYVSIAISMRFARGFVKEADVIYVYATPMTVADPARAWSRSLGIPFILHVQDLWPESVTGSGILPGAFTRSVQKPLDWWLARVYRAAEKTIAIAPSMRRMLVHRGVPEDRAVSIFNWSDDSDAVRPSTASPTETGLHLVYAGNLGRMQDLETVVRAVAEVRELEDLKVSIAGSGVIEPELRRLVDELGVANVEFLGRLSPREVSALYEVSDFQFVTLKDLPIFEGTIPSKFQAGIANGVPAICTVRGDLRALVEQRYLGFTAEAEDVESLAGAIRAAYRTTRSERSQFRHRVREYYEADMSRTAAIDAIEALLRDAAQSRRK